MHLFRIALLMLTATGLVGQAQNITHNFTPQGKRVVFDFKYADVQLQSWPGAEVKVEGTVLINRGEDNTRFVLEEQSSASTSVLLTYIDNIDALPNLIIGYKNGEKHYLGEAGDRGSYGKNKWRSWEEELGIEKGAYDNIHVGPEIDIDLQIFVPLDVDLKVESLYGDIDIADIPNRMVVDNTYGYVVAILPQGAAADIALRSEYDVVDVAIPASSDLLLELRSNYGDIYTDLDFEVDKRRSESGMYKQKIVSVLNQGGPSLKLQATYDNVYVRRLK